MVLNMTLEKIVLNMTLERNSAKYNTEKKWC